MFRFSQAKTKSLVDLHGWFGVSLGLLLYAVVVTGAVAVFAKEILAWSAGAVYTENPFERNINDVVAGLAKQVDPAYLEEVSLSASSRGYLNIFFHAHLKDDNGNLQDYGTRFEVNPESGQVIKQTTGSAMEIRAADDVAVLSRFLVNIHTELHLPRPWGLLTTGILGLAMLVAAISGLFMHRHLFKDILTLRRQRSNVLVKRDAHTVAGSWGLPFAFILAFTGSFFSFAGAFGIPAMAMVAFEGDQEAMIRTVIGSPEVEPGAAHTMVSLDDLIADANSRAGVYPENLILTHYNREQSIVTLQMPAAEGGLAPRLLEYKAASGVFIGEKPILGLVPSAGATVFSLMAPLHFGDFAGVLSKIVWAALGFASCYMTLTGLFLWLERRKEINKWQVYGRFVTGLAYGLPIAMLSSAIGFFLSALVSGDTSLWVPTSFCAMGIAVLLLAVVRSDQNLVKQQLALLCALFLFIVPVLRLLAGGPFWLEALGHGAWQIVFIDWLLLGFGCWALYLFFQTRALPKEDESPYLPLDQVSEGT